MADHASDTPRAAGDHGEAQAHRVEEVEARSAVFRKELGMRDLVLTQIMYVVGSFWVGTAAKLGDQHLVFWCLAIALFYLPQAAVVVFLNRLMPLEGGLYQWATVGLGRFLGYLTAWNLWAYTVLIMATFGVMIATNLGYLLAPLGATFVTAWWYTAAVSASSIVGLTIISLFGVRVSKWLQNIGGTTQLLMFSALIVVPFIALRRGTASTYHPLAVAMPAFTLFSLNVFGKMAVGALSGFEYVAILAGECRNPARSIGRATVVAVPIIALMFILGTSSVLGLVPQDQIDLVSPIPQTLGIGFAGLGFARLIVPVLILFLLARQLGNVALIFAGNTRLPMVAGWDGLLPAWFTRLHPKYHTPYNSIFFVGALTLAITMAGQIGVGLQEAFQLLENAAGIFYGFTYLALFAIPLFGARRLSEAPPLWLRVASACGFAVTLLYCTLSVFPIIDVPSWTVFALKIITVLVAANLVGIGIYVLAKRRGA
jgi:glutamate:GABA antiporter